jgi:hypothetical protein
MKHTTAVGKQLHQTKTLLDVGTLQDFHARTSTVDMIKAATSEAYANILHGFPGKESFAASSPVLYESFPIATVSSCTFFQTEISPSVIHNTSLILLYRLRSSFLNCVAVCTRRFADSNDSQCCLRITEILLTVRRNYGVARGPC